MAITFQQTDTEAACGNFLACSGASQLADNSAVSSDATQDGTAGTTEQTVKNSAGVNNVAAYMVQCSDAPTNTNWDSGDWVVDFEVTTGNTNITLQEIHICHIDGGACSTTGTIGSMTGIGQAMSAGIHSYTISGSEVSSPNTSSDPYIVWVFDFGGNHGNEDMGVTPSQTIDSPITIASEQISENVGTQGMYSFSLQNVITSIIGFPNVLNQNKIQGQLGAILSEVVGQSYAPPLSPIKPTSEVAGIDSQRATSPNKFLPNIVGSISQEPLLVEKFLSQTIGTFSQKLSFVDKFLNKIFGMKDEKGSRIVLSEVLIQELGIVSQELSLLRKFLVNVVGNVVQKFSFVDKLLMTEIGTEGIKGINISKFLNGVVGGVIKILDEIEKVISEEVGSSSTIRRKVSIPLREVLNPIQDFQTNTISALLVQNSELISTSPTRNLQPSKILTNPIASASNQILQTLKKIEESFSHIISKSLLSSIANSETIPTSHTVNYTQDLVKIFNERVAVKAEQITSITSAISRSLEEILGVENINQKGGSRTVSQIVGPVEKSLVQGSKEFSKKIGFDNSTSTIHQKFVGVAELFGVDSVKNFVTRSQVNVRVATQDTFHNISTFLRELEETQSIRGSVSTSTISQLKEVMEEVVGISESVIHDGGLKQIISQTIGANGLFTSHSDLSRLFTESVGIKGQGLMFIQKPLSEVIGFFASLKDNISVILFEDLGLWRYNGVVFRKNIEEVVGAVEKSVQKLNTTTRRTVARSRNKVKVLREELQVNN